MTEIWLEIKDFENLYLVSNFGRVKSKDREILDSRGRKRLIKGKILTPKYNKSNGYNQVCLSKDNKPYYRYIHRLVAETFIANDYGYSDVNHIDSCKTNNNCNNLEWVNRKGNMEHAVKNSLLGQMKEIEVYHIYKGLIDTLSSISDAKRKYKKFEGAIDNSCDKNIVLGYLMFHRKKDNKALKEDGSLNYSKINYRYNRIYMMDNNFNILKIFENEVEAHNYMRPNTNNNGQISYVCKNKHYYKGYIWYFEEEFKYLKSKNLLTKYKNNVKKVAQYSLEGDLVKIYDSIAEAEKSFSKNGTSNGAISHIFNDKMRNKTAYGFNWELL